MFYSAQSQIAVNCLIAPFHINVNSDTVTSMLSSLTKEDISACIEYARANGMLPLFAARLEKMKALSYLPFEFHNELSHMLAKARQSGKEQLQDTIQVALALQDHDIPYLVLKGVVFAYLLYPETGVRPSRDLDLLIPPSFVSKASDILQQLGFSPVPNMKEPAHHLARMFKLRPDGTRCVIEPHHRLVPSVIYGIGVREIESIWEHSMWVDIGGGNKICTLSHSDHVLHMHLHLLHHLFYNFRLMHLIDIVFAARCWEALVDWSNIAEQLHWMGLERFRRDLWGWVRANFGDELPCQERIIPEDAKRIGCWLFRHGSLPSFEGLRYSKNSQEWIRTFTNECRRHVYRSLWAPGWGLFYSGKQ